MPKPLEKMLPNGLTIDVIGRGNVATHVVQRFVEQGGRVRFIASRTPNGAHALASAAGAEPKTIEELAADRSAIPLILAVNDDQIQALSVQFSTRFLVHTSGSVSMDTLQSERRGVLYPLQSFSKNREVDWNTLPICIEAASLDDRDQLHTIAKLLGHRVEHVSSEERRKLHLAAVVVNNFVNYLYQASAEYLNAHGLAFDCVHPLMRETVEKAIAISPSSAQTGPARRNDQQTILAHLEALSGQPELQDLYRRLSDAITRSYHG